MKIGNIVISEPVKVNHKFNVVNSINDIIPDLPTLIVGIDEVLKTYDKLDYVNRIINNKIRWTFNNKEKRVIFEDDLFYFIRYCYTEISIKYQYRFIDLILTSDDEIKNIFKELKKSNNISYISNSMIYLFNNKEIIGFNINQINYMDKSVDKFKNLIKKLSIDIIDGEDNVKKFSNELELLNNEVKYIPLLQHLNR